MDTDGFQDSFVVAENAGFAKRQTLCAASASVHIVTRIHADVFLQNRLFPPMVSFGITLHNTVDAFRVRSNVVLAERHQKVAIQSIRLLCTKVTLNAGLHVQVLSAMRTNAMRFPVDRVVMYSFERPAGE